MTTGSKIIPQSGPLFDNGGGPTPSGYMFTKTWSGANQPKLKTKWPRSPPFPYYIWVRNRRGQSVRVIHYHPGVPVRPPKRALARGEHAYDMSLVEMTDNIFRYRLVSDVYSTTHNLYPNRSTVTYMGAYPVICPWTANDQIALVGKLKEKINGSDFDMSLFLGTSHQTLGLLANAATRIYKAYRLVRKGQVGRAATALTGLVKPNSGRTNKTNAKALSAAWLELQYGWRPLVQDAFNAATYIAHSLSAPAVKSYTQTLRREVKIDSNTNGSHFEGQSFAYGKIVARLREEPSQIAKLGLQDPSNLLWELLPWSFVADWFIPIGQYLSARSFASHLTGTFITTITKKVIVHGYRMPPTIVSDGGNSNYKRKVVTTSRTVSTTLSVPTPRFKPLSKAASYMHAANAVALLTQVSLKGSSVYRR